MTFEELREKFMSSLLSKARTRKQARELAAQMGIDDDEAIINEAEELGLIDDCAFARLFAEGHEQWGNLKISHELAMRGVSRGDITEALDEITGESERAEELADNWKRSGLDERKIRNRLLSRGFSSRAVGEALSG